MKSHNRFIEHFSKQTTIHGLHLLNLPKIHIFERFFWVTVVAIAAVGAVSIAYSNWRRYQANPTVVSLQKDFRNWQNPFPAATGCLANKADDEQMELYIKTTWNLDNSSHPDYRFYSNFLKAVANISYANLDIFERFSRNDSVSNIDMLDLVIKIHPKHTGTLVTSDTRKKFHWQFVMTEMGLCFTVNSKLVDLLGIENDRKKKVQDIENGSIMKCHYLNGLCYARYDSDPSMPIKYYIHSYHETVHATCDPPLLVHQQEELEINYRMQQTESSKSLRDLSPNQRRCHFFDEPIDPQMPIYTLSTCYMMCRYRATLNLCGCKPFFYHTLPGKVCDVTGLACLARHAKNLTKSPVEIGCRCPQPCDFVAYFPQVPKYTKWEYGYFDQRITFRWGILPPTTKFHRDVLFGFEDLIVSFGGTFALFWGISFMSGVETVFLILENLYLMWQNK